jgi:MAF protein
LHLKKEKLVLASASPRRRQLLAEAGIDFTAAAPRVDESAFATGGVGPREYSEQLALAKARSVAAWYPENLVVGADTVVDAGGEIIGKPQGPEDAERITRKLFGAPHKVITGIAIVRLSTGTEITGSDTTVVYPRELTDEQVRAHIRSKVWKDKAGAYAIQAEGDRFIERIEGSFTNVVGLPMELLQKLLEEQAG